MMQEEDEFPNFYDENNGSEVTQLLPPPHSEESSSKSRSSRSSSVSHSSSNADEGLRRIQWLEASALEKKFLHLVESGDVDRVKSFLEQNTGFNINARIDTGGAENEPAICTAVGRGDERMVALLLEQPGIQLMDCPLIAARDGRVSLVLLLLDHLKKSHGAENEDRGCPGSERFHDDMTPLMVAAQYGHVALIRQLLRRNHQIVPPHPPKCFCPEVCSVRLDALNGLRASYERLRLYKALSSPAYLCVAVDDPILRAFQLYRELQTCSLQEQALGAEYDDLAETVRTFAVHLLACCRTNDEVDMVLARKRGFHAKGPVEMPRLLLAMECGQKEFVAHPCSQHVLYTKWLGESPGWAQMSIVKTLIIALSRLFILPILAVMGLVLPSNPWVRRLSSPVNRLFNHVASYLVFLALVFVEANLDKTSHHKGPPRSGIEWLLVLFVLGQEWNLGRLLYLQGFKRFFAHMWNIYDVVMLQLFWLWLSLWMYATQMCSGATLAERKFWPSLHPVLLAESVFAVATILAFGRLLFLCQLNRTLGPMQVSLGKMTLDLGQCIIIWIIILLSFSAGLNKLYQYYDGMIQELPGTGVKLVQPSSFVDFISTLKTLFWGVFGLTPPEYAVVVVENLPDGTINEHGFTQGVGMACFSLYMLLTTIMIVNVLVAKMTNTYQKVVDNVAIEWTFGKTQVYMSYMQQTVLPPPLNLLPTASGLHSLYTWIRKVIARKHDYEMVNEDVEKNEEEAYHHLMDDLAQRYLHNREAVTSDGIGVELEPTSLGPSSSVVSSPEFGSVDAKALTVQLENAVTATMQHFLREVREELSHPADTKSKKR